MKRVLSWVFFVAYPIVLLMFFASILTTTPYMRLSKGLYSTHDDIYYDHMYVARELIGFINYRHDDMYFGADPEDTEPVMTQIAIDHMVDVRDVYTRLRITAGIALVVVIGLAILMIKSDIKWFYETLKNSFWLPLGFIAFVGTWFAIDFNRIFTWFHLLFFDGGWQLPSIPHPLEPGRMIHDPLILLVPEAFWLVSGSLIIVGVALTYGATWWINQKVVYPLVIKDTNKENK